MSRMPARFRGLRGWRVLATLPADELSPLEREKVGFFLWRGYLQSRGWRRFRAQVIASRGGRCERCGSEERLHLHHLTYERAGDELVDDVEVLCGPCHAGVHLRRGA